MMPRDALSGKATMPGHLGNVRGGQVVAMADGLATLVSDCGKRNAVPMPQTTPAKDTVVWIAVREIG